MNHWAKVFYMILFTVTTLPLFAQTPAAPPLPVRQVSGILIDSAGHPVIGAHVILTSKSDTLKTRSNEDGLFFFKDVKEWEFTLTVSSLGYRSLVKIGKYNHSKPRLTLDPIILHSSITVLDEVVLRGGPTIIFKTDTVEYRASDYVVREGANVADLLNKMNGMSVSSDGSLTYNGTVVEKAKLNGKDFLAGDVPTVTKNLPAEIVEKVQIIDDYGDEAARTGIKEGNPKKSLNITTRLDRSVGYFAKIAGGGGNDERYEGNILGTKINANRNYALSVSTSNTINGVSSAPGASVGPPSEASSGGNTVKQGALITYRDQWGKKTQVNANYSFNSINLNSLNSSVIQNFSTNGTTYLNTESSALSNFRSHTLKLEVETDLDSSNYLKIIPYLSYNSGNVDNDASALLTGLIRQNQISNGTNITKTPNYGASVLFQHTYRKTRRNYSLFISGSNRNNESEKQQNTSLTYFNLLTDAVLKDSLVRRIINRDNLTGNYTGNFTYSLPVGNAVPIPNQLSFGAQFNYNDYNNQNNISGLSTTGALILIDSLSNIFKYSFAQSRLAIRYRFAAGKSFFTTGFAVVPTALSGNNQSLGTSVNQKSLDVMPIFQFQYLWSQVKRLSVNYTGTIIEPLFDQVQPVRDVTDPQNIVVGNPSLKLALNHTLSTSFNSYYANSRFGFDAGFAATMFENQVILNTIQVKDAYNSFKYERHFLNANGSYKLSANYLVNKALSNRKYSFFLTGTIDRRFNTGLNNNDRNITRQWIFTEKLGSRMTPVSGLEINPSVSYNLSSSVNSLPSAADSKIKIWALNLDGKYFSTKSWWLTYNLTQNFVDGLSSNLVNNPLVFNSSLGMDFLKNKTAALSLSVFDLFNQNKALYRSITENSITDTRSNWMSRYLMVNLNFNLQRWKGTPQRNGGTPPRRGDGSFIY